MTNFKKYFLLSLIVALLNATLLLVFFVPRFDHPDTRQYVSTIDCLTGNQQGEIVASRILKPLPILIGVWLSPFLEAKNTLVAQNLAFYFLSVCLIFFIVYRFYQNEKQAFYGTVLYVGAYPMMAYGLAALTDMPGWFFYLLSVFIALRLIEKPQLKIAFLSGLMAGIGMLFKENVIAVPLFFVVFVFIATKISVKEKLKHILAFGTAFVLFPIINSIIIYKLYSFSYLDWFRIGGIHSEGIGGSFYMISPLRIIIEIGRVFLIGWIFVFLGILKELTIKNIERIKILFALIFSSLYVFLWCYPHNRMMYVVAPPLVLLGSFGLLRKHKNSKINVFMELVLLSLYILVNYAILEFLLRYGTVIQPPGTLFG